MKKVNNCIFPVIILSILFVILILPTVSQGADFFSNLKLTEISVKGHKLHIKGETDLPQGSILNIHIDLSGLNGKYGKGDKIKVHVNSQRFFVQVDLPKKGSWHGKLAWIKVIFKPNEQGADIKAKVGNRGEKLKGAKAKQEKGNKYLEESKVMIL